MKISTKYNGSNVRVLSITDEKTVWLQRWKNKVSSFLFAAGSLSRAGSKIKV